MFPEKLPLIYSDIDKYLDDQYHTYLNEQHTKHYVLTVQKALFKVLERVSNGS